MLIALGDGSFHRNSADHLTMLTGHKMFQELGALGEHICWVDEFCSSKCCSACGADTVDAIFAKKALKTRTGKRKGRLRGRARYWPIASLLPINSISSNRNQGEHEHSGGL
jgi:hypothetical protein